MGDPVARLLPPIQSHQEMISSGECKNRLPRYPVERWTRVNPGSKESRFVLKVLGIREPDFGRRLWNTYKSGTRRFYCFDRGLLGFDCRLALDRQVGKQKLFEDFEEARKKENPMAELIPKIESYFAKKANLKVSTPFSKASRNRNTMTDAESERYSRKHRPHTLTPTRFSQCQ